MSDCVLCEQRPTAQGAACSKCAGWLRRDLRAVPGVLVDLDITYSGRARLSRRVGARSSDTPLPFNGLAGDRRRELEQQVRQLAADATPCLDDPNVSAARVAQIAASAIPQVLRGPNLKDNYAAFTLALRAARRAIDRPTARRYFGPCAVQYDDGMLCEGSVYLYDTSPTPECSTCKEPYNLGERKDWVMQVTEDWLDEPRWISEHLCGLGKRVSTALIQKWVKRDRLQPRASRVSDHAPLYRVGDVADLHLAGQARTFSPLERELARKLAK